MRDHPASRPVVHAFACAAVLAASVAAGCGGSTDATPVPAHGEPGPRPVPADATTITGGSALQRTLLRDLLRRMEATGIASVSIEPPGNEWKPHGADDVMLRLTWADGDDSETQWEASVLAGAFGERSRAEGLPELVAFQGPGAGVRIAGVPGEGGHPPARPAAPEAGTVAAAVRTAAEKEGARVTSLDTAVLDQRPVLRLRLAVDDPAPFLLQRLPLILAALPSTLGARFVDVYDPSGERVFMTGQFTMSGMTGGLGWTKPELESCSPIVHSQPVFSQPAPCPFDGPRVLAREGAAPTLDVGNVARTATERAHADEKVTLLDVGEAGELCRGWRVDCPTDGRRTAWLAAIGPRSDNANPTRFVLIDDGDGHVLGSGELP